MHLQHFGDSHDIVKKSLFEWLRELGPWTAHPMFTDVDPDAAIVDQFAQFLDVPLVWREVLRVDTDRVAHFNACRDAGHLLLDQLRDFDSPARGRIRGTSIAMNSFDSPPTVAPI